MDLKVAVAKAVGSEEGKGRRGRRCSGRLRRRRRGERRLVGARAGAEAGMLAAPEPGAEGLPAARGQARAPSLGITGA